MTWRWKPGDAISRRLFEALRLEIRYDHTAYMTTCKITLTGASVRPPEQKYTALDKIEH